MSPTPPEPDPADASWRYSAKRTVHHVDFFCDAPQAQGVRLVGDFNGWDLTAMPMRRLPDGRWMASTELHHGHHQYLFVVDGNLTLDPNASGVIRNECDNQVSLIAVS
jgi:1,4-alpha-glucan branching enzyme